MLKAPVKAEGGGVYADGFKILGGSFYFYFSEQFSDPDAC